jgi:hypothetical protein
MKVIIAGSRGFNDYKFLCEICDDLFKNCQKVEIVSGTANGADKLGEKYAKERGYKLHRFPANWDKFGKSAGYIRNEEMANFSKALIVFWDRKSKGTKHMIDLANDNGLLVSVNYF